MTDDMWHIATYLRLLDDPIYNRLFFSNRAACYTKLMEFGLAMQDCDKCIEINPMFVKGYLRKAAVLKIDKPQVSSLFYTM